MQVAILSFSEILSPNIESFRKSAALKGIEVLEIEPTKLSLVVSANRVYVQYQNQIFKPAVIIHRTVSKFTTLIRPIIRILEESGTLILNDVDAALVSRSKLESAIKFRENNIPFLESHFFFPGENFETSLNDPLVSKPVYGSQGREIRFFNSQLEANTFFGKQPRDISDLTVEPHLVQKDLGEESRDLRAYVVGDKCVALMERLPAKGERLANLAQGGIGKALDVRHPAADLAIQTVKAFGLDFAGVDVLAIDDKYFLSEIDAWAGFAGIEKVCGVSVSEAIFDYIFEKLGNK